MKEESFRATKIEASLRARNERSNPLAVSELIRGLLPADSTRKAPLSALAMTALFATTLSSCTYFKSSELINGSHSPEIEVPDRNGEIINLSSFRGNLVLVNFWASWCKPCREENPKLVALYDKYKDSTFQKADGFRILSISLDSEKDKWLKAINEDSLHWENHASDLKSWSSPAADSFRVSSIPAIFLIDQNGIIIGKDLKMKEFDKLLGMLVAK